MSLEEYWAVGIFEGEGTITLLKHANSCKLAISMTDLDVLERIQRIWGGAIYKKKAHHKWKQAWTWAVCRKEVVSHILLKILPLLGERRACKALDALDRLEGCYESYGVMS